MIKTVKIEDKKYPGLLKKIKDPPPLLYYIGKLPQEKEICFAIVGTRRYSLYGKKIALEISGRLAEAGLSIVSGLAPGIDTFAHLAALENQGRTIAVLGTGLDKKSFYPKENIKLAQKIVEKGGCLISEYPPGTRGTRFTFPQRNRIIAGLSQGVLVIEAKQKSGSLITANFAKREKRKLFAVPGSIYSLNSKGPHLLIKKGAKLAEKPEDIIKELGLNLKLRPSLDKNGKRERLSAEEELILQALKGQILEINKIIEKTKLSAQKANTALAILEIKGRVKNLGGNNYSLA